MSEPHERLNEAMNARRLTLRMNWREVASAAGVSAEALRAVRRGDYRPAELTARRLDDALRWEAGTVTRILEGGEPIPIDEMTAPATAEAKAAVAGASIPKIDNPTPTEAALLAYLAAMEQQLANVTAQVDRQSMKIDELLERERDSNEQSRQRRGA